MTHWEMWEIGDVYLVGKILYLIVCVNTTTKIKKKLKVKLKRNGVSWWQTETFIMRTRKFKYVFRNKVSKQNCYVITKQG